MWRPRLAALIPVAIFLILAALFLTAIYRGDPSRLPSPLVGRYVPSFDLPPVAGLDVPGLSSADFGKGTPMVVNVWASWCVPCREEHSVLVALKGLIDVPLVALNYKDDPESAARFLGALGNPFSRVGADSTGRVSIDWGVYGVPETYVVDGHGLIVYKHVGPLTPEALDSEILPALKKAQTGK